MFTTHFKMTQQPFQEFPPIEGFFSHEAFSQGIARLNYFASGQSDGNRSLPHNYNSQKWVGKN